MKKKKIYIRADGSTEIGLGHLVRCMALAQMLKKDFQIYFYSIKIPDNISNDIVKQGFLTKKIDSEEDFFQDISGNEIIVLDHYGLDTAYQKKIKRTGSKLVCIDDLHDKIFYADLIINHTPGVKASHYNAQPHTRFALGLEFALLRPSFLENTNEKRVIGSIETLFICFGGSDIRNLTEKCLTLALNIKLFKNIKVVVGAAYKEVEKIKAITGQNDHVELFQAIDEEKMLILIKASDLAVVPASGILYEVVSTSTPAITGAYVDNQKYFLDRFSKLSFVKSAGNFDEEVITKSLNEFLMMKNVMTENYIDGKSAERMRYKFKLLM